MALTGKGRRKPKEYEERVQNIAWSLTPRLARPRAGSGTSRLLFPDGFDGFIYYIIFACRVSLFICIYPVRDKCAQTFITCALERLCVFVQTTHPDMHLLSIHGDSDAAVSRLGHGEDQDTLAIKAYNENFAHPILIKRSPANVHHMNALEPQQKRVNYLANHAGMIWILGRRFAIGLVVSAAEQLNDRYYDFRTS